MATFRFTSFLWRWAIAVVLVLITFNPTDWSYYDWVTQSGGSIPLKILLGLLLLVGFVIFLRASFRSLGAIGIVLTGGLLAVLAWLLADMKWLDLGDLDILTWVGLFILATIMAVGVSWSHIRRKISGQQDMDDLDEP
ncbi:MAG: DUF6524 family protein [Xanthomonadales bacterium]|nr:DUF6524 family protein [Xanthomonadales bacterium]